MLRAPPILALLGAMTACAPTSQYRYTALVPSVRPLAWDGRTAKGGSLRLEGDFAASNIQTNQSPQLHDTALNVATTEISGLAALAIIDELEIGIRGSYSSYAWSNPSAIGTEPLPSHPTLWGVGPEIRSTIAFDRGKHFAVGVGISYLHYQVPYAAWQLTGPSAMPATPSCVQGPQCTVDLNTFGGAHYQLATETSETHWAINLGAYPSYAFGPGGEYGRAFAVLAAHTGFTNDGFTNTAQNNSTLSSGIVWLVGIGYGITFSPVHLSALAFQPFNGSSSGVSYGPGVIFTVGVDVALWGGGDDLPRRPVPPHEPYPAPPPAVAPAPPPQPYPAPAPPAVAPAPPPADE